MPQAGVSALRPRVCTVEQAGPQDGQRFEGEVPEAFKSQLLAELKRTIKNGENSVLLE